MTAAFTLAVHAMVYLSHKGTVVSSAELADNICTNPARVRKVMSALHKAGLVEALQGQGSGYRALPDTERLTLDAILQALDEQPVTTRWRSGDIDRECLVSSGMAEVMSEVYGEVNEACRARLASITIGTISDRIFSGEARHDS